MGFLKERYLIQVDTNGIGIIHRFEVDKELLVLPEESSDIKVNIKRNPKWISSLLYTFIFGIFTVLGIHLTFRNRICSLISGIFYLCMLVISGLIIFISAQFDAFETGYLAGQHIKNFVQSPLVIMVLFFVFYFMEKNKDTEGIEKARRSRR